MHPTQRLSARMPRHRLRFGLAATLLAGLAGCGAPASPAFDLSAGHQRVEGGISGQLVVTEPAALQPLESERIIVKDAAGSVSYLGGAQWSDRLPRLFQTRLIETFENASRLKAVARPGEGITGDYQLNTELRAFQFEAGRGEAVVSVAIKLIAVPTGRIVRAQIFTGRAPVASSNGPEVAQALNRALSTVLLDIVRFVGTGH